MYMYFSHGLVKMYKFDSFITSEQHRDVRCTSTQSTSPQQNILNGYEVYAAYIGEVERAAKRNMVDSDYLEAVFSFKNKIIYLCHY